MREGSADTPPSAPEAARRCPSCDGETFAVPPDAPRAGAFSVARCTVCGLGVTTPAPGAADLAAAYPPEHYGGGGPRFRPGAERLASALRHGRASWIAGLHPPGAVLDVGCGHGYMLAGLRDRGWRVQGVELHDEAAAYPRRALGLPVAVGALETLGFAAASFDAIVFWQSFEHLPDPLGTLREAVRLLRPGGLVIVSVPNAASWQARWAGPGWFHWELPRHLYHWDPTTLGRLFDRAGLRVVRTSHANWEQNPFGWMQSILNRLGFPPNQFYNGMMACRGEDAAGPRWQRLLGPPLLAAGFLLAAVETLARHGGTIVFVGRRTGEGMPT